MNNKLTVSFKNGEVVTLPYGTEVKAFADQMAEHYPYQIMLGKVGNNLKELRGSICEDVKDFEFVLLNEKDGMRVYQRSATFLLIAAAKRVVPSCHILVNHHITGDIFVSFQIKHVAQRKIFA